MKKLILLCFLTSTAFAQYYPYPQPVFPKYCDGSNMISNAGRVLYQFSFSSGCTEALNQSKTNFGRFCDDEKLVRENGQVAHYFTFSSDCNDGLAGLSQSRYGLYC